MATALSIVQRALYMQPALASSQEMCTIFMQSPLSWRSGRQFDVPINHNIDGKCDFFRPVLLWFWLLLSMIKNNLEKKGYISPRREAGAGTPDRSLKLTTEGALHRLATRLDSAAVYIQLYTGISERGPSTSTSNQGNTSQSCPQANLTAAIPRRRALFPGVSGW